MATATDLDRHCAALPPAGTPCGPPVYLCRDDERGTPKTVFVYREPPAATSGYFGFGWAVGPGDDPEPAPDEMMPEKCLKLYGVCPKPGECIKLQFAVVDRSTLPAQEPKEEEAEHAARAH